MKIAIVVSKFNREINQGLLEGALSTLQENKIDRNSIHIFDAPGAFEMPLISKMIGKTEKFDGIICLGSVIKGDTAHFEYISQAASLGLMKTTLKLKIPVTFGILTVYTHEQAVARSVAGAENKGREAALACVETIQTLNKIKNEFN